MPFVRQNHSPMDFRKYLRAPWVWTLLLTIIYMVGFVGIIYPPTRSITVSLTPVNLLLCASVLIFFERQRNAGFIAAALVTAILGFTVEWIGITTGFPFGTYHYEETLGIKFAGVPLIIGLNWFILIYSTQTLGVQLPHWLNAGLGATIMMGYDLLLEPFAIRFDLWEWHQTEVPLQNYIAWWGISFGLHLLFRRMAGKRKNPLAIAVLTLQSLFFFFLLLF
jgi:uncharacterized membrane protein